jgi:hypothetical protein
MNEKRIISFSHLCERTKKLVCFIKLKTRWKLCSEVTCSESRLKHSVTEIFRFFLSLYGQTPQLGHTIFQIISDSLHLPSHAIQFEVVTTS